MNDGIEACPGKNFFEERFVADISLDHLNTTGHRCGKIPPLNLRIIEIIEIINHNHLMAAIHEGIDGMGADKPGSACDEDLQEGKTSAAVKRPARKTLGGKRANLTEDPGEKLLTVI